MVKVANLTNEVVIVLGWKILPMSNIVVAPDGRRLPGLPQYVAAHEILKRLIQGACINVRTTGTQGRI